MTTASFEVICRSGTQRGQKINHTEAEMFPLKDDVVQRAIFLVPDSFVNFGVTPSP